MANDHLIQTETNGQPDRPMKVGDVVTLDGIPYRILVMTEGIGIFIQLENNEDEYSAGFHGFHQIPGIRRGTEAD